MKSEENTLRFFLGTNTPQGFVSEFSQMADAEDGWRLIVIKGGPGSGKSVMLGKIAEHMRANGRNIELIHCAADVELIDGVILPELRCAIADGTPPHGKVHYIRKSQKASILTQGAAAHLLFSR